LLPNDKEARPQSAKKNHPKIPGGIGVWCAKLNFGKKVPISLKFNKIDKVIIECLNKVAYGISIGTKIDDLE